MKDEEEHALLSAFVVHISFLSKIDSDASNRIVDNPEPTTFEWS